MGPAFANTVAFNIVLDLANRFDGIHCLCFCCFVLSFTMAFHLTDRFSEIHRLRFCCCRPAPFDIKLKCQLPLCWEKFSDPWVLLLPT
jgi:hypothetical protein